MSVTRKYNKGTKKWEVVSASSASTISVRSEKLLPDNAKETNVEEVLGRMSDDIQTLKGNVSWLAEHGGGGSGSGGGGSVLAEIKVNGKASGESIVLDDLGLTVNILSSSSSLKWQISIVGGSKVLKSVKSGTSVTISKDEITKAGLAKTFSLAITAFNEDTLTNVYWDGTIQISTIELLTKTEVSYNFVDLEKPSSQIIYTCTVGVLGLYFLYVNDKKIGDAIMFSETTKEVTVTLGDLLNKYGISFAVGLNTLTARMTSAQDEAIASNDCSSLVLLVSNVPVINCRELSIDKDNRTPIYLNIGKDTVLSVPYTVYYKSGVYKALILTGYNKKVAWSSITLNNTYNTYYENASCTLPDTLVVDTDIEITIVIYDMSSLTEYSQVYYGTAKQPDYGLLTVPDSIFTFRSFYGAITDGLWKEKNATLDIKNINVKSKAILLAQNKSLRLLNASYAIISNNGKLSFYYDYITDQIKQFSLSICYKCDFHPDDQRTILSFALTANDIYHTPNQGIMIRDHKLYIAQNTFDLQDQELMTITITYKQDLTTGLGNVFLYVNGVVESVFSDMRPELLIPVNQKQIILAALIEDNQAMYYCDTNIYRVSMYNTCLNPVDCLYEYLNDQACANLKDNNPDTTYIADGLKRNFISLSKGGYLSLLYDTSKSFDNNVSDFNQYFALSNLVSQGGTFSIKSDILNMIVPIPIMTIDVSNSVQWTWSNFIMPNTNLSKINCDFSYYDLNGTNNDIISGRCYVNIQGTSTLSDAIKNLTLSFDDDVIFVPKDTWFPEQEYTMKADIVDSSHSLNASIGKFINTEFGMKYNEDGTIKNNSSWYPFSDTVKDSFCAQKALGKKSDMNKYFPKGTLKHGVEGFPVFLIIKFKSEEEGSLSIRSLGIYQFILGRKSPRNLGYQIIKNVTFANGDPNLTYPLYAESVNIECTENPGYWIEATLNDPFPDSLKFQEREDLTDAKMTGLFWQSDIQTSSDGKTSAGPYYDDAMEIKYQNVGSKAVSRPSDFLPFREFISNVIKLPVTNRRYSLSGNGELVRHTISNSSYPVYVSKNTENGILWSIKDNQYNRIFGSGGDDLATALRGLNISCFTKYFVICMLFGLIDNFEKNMPIKFYAKKDSDGKLTGKWENAILGIYDTDTGLGGDNEALLSVSLMMWISTLLNSNGALCETSDTIQNTKTTIIGQNNKLWWFDSEQVNYAQFNGAKSGSAFSALWNSLIRQLEANNDIASISLSDVVNIYYNNYFLQLTAGCGELLFNLTYFSKYLNKYISGTTTINQANRLHGRRRQQVRSWLKGRVVFLDSMYQAMGTNTAYSTTNSEPLTHSSVSLTTGSTHSFSITANNPIITYISHQGSSGLYLALNQNEQMNVYWGNSETAKQSFNHVITYSDSILKLGSDSQKLSDIYFVKVNNGQLPYLTDFDASNCTELDNEPQNAIGKFKPTSGISELRTIDLSNTAKNGNASINYVLNLSSGYEKLLKLNLYNSCVTSLFLPTGDNSIPLLEFDIRGCQLTSLDLLDQNLLTKLDLTNCYRLGSLTIKDCNQLTSLTLDKSQGSLNTVSITNETFESFTCDSNISVSSIYIQSTALKTVKITNCTKLTDVTIIGHNIERIDLGGCSNLVNLILTTDQTSITTLNLYQTSVKCIKKTENEKDSDVLDLSRFTSIGSFNIQSNPEVEYIRFANIKGSPIKITNGFRNTNLKRVYGNIALYCDGAFMQCSKFSILGSDMTYDGVSMVDTDGRVKHFSEVPSVCENGQAKFQEGDDVTNIQFAITSANADFSYTSCTVLDAYYALYNPGKATSFTNAFCYCKTLKFGWTEECDNSPHRKMLINCGKVQALYGLFEGCDNSTMIRLWSPTNNGSSVSADDGLFSPVISSCNNIGRMFIDFTVVYDRFLFRTTGDRYILSSISYFGGRYIVDDVNKAEPTIDYMLANIGTMGNLKGFFTNLPLLVNLSCTISNAFVINYDLSCLGEETDGIFTYGTDCRSSLVADACIGEIKLDKLFKNPLNVKIITGCFRSRYGTYAPLIHLSYDNATFKIKQGMLDKFTNLLYIGYYLGGRDDDSSTSTYSFLGTDIIKEFDDESFPYDIFAKCPNLIECSGFFANAQKGNINQTDIELPGILFQNNTKLTSVNMLFKNMPFQFSISSDSFKNCPNLMLVYALFYNNQSNIKGSISKRLLYHGGTTATRTYTGANLYNDDKTGYKYNPEDYDEDGNQIGIKEDDLKTITITYEQPNQNITWSLLMFYNCNLESYLEESPTIEQNPEYMPFTHIIQNGQIKKVTYNDIKTTCMWEYDGVNLPSGYDGENLDEEVDRQQMGELEYLSGYKKTCDLHFAFPPDLFRYFKDASNTDITYMFEGCGYKGVNTNANHATPLRPNDQYGLKGRIVPYMFKNLSQIININSIFRTCNVLSYYTTEGGLSYTIPKTLFKYAPNITNLLYAFSNMTFPASIQLDIFGSLKKAIDISYIFYLCRWNATSDEHTSVNGIFRGKQITDLYKAFSVDPGTTNQAMHEYKTDSYIDFNGVFTSDKVVKNKDWYVFDGFSKSCVTFTNKSLSQDNVEGDVRYNYRTR